METNSQNPNHPLTLGQIVEALKAKRDKGNNFAGSLVAGFTNYGNFTEKQRPWAEKLAREEIFGNAANSTRPAQKTEDLGGDFRKLIEKFETAKNNGLKRPALTFNFAEIGKTKIYPAPATGANPGFLYVKGGNGGYFGKINNVGIFTRGRDCTDTLAGFLREIALDPVKFSASHGRQVGSCCFCARELTTRESLFAGYGPVCADKWNLPWGDY